MAGDIVTLFNRKGPNSPVVAIDLKSDEAEHALSRWPFAWSRDKTFAPWPWPAMGTPRQAGRSAELEPGQMLNYFALTLAAIVAGAVITFAVSVMGPPF